MSHRLGPSGRSLPPNPASGIGSAYVSQVAPSVPSLKSQSQAPFASVFGASAPSSSNSGTLQFGSLPSADSVGWGSQVRGSLGSVVPTGSNAPGLSHSSGTPSQPILLTRSGPVVIDWSSVSQPYPPHGSNLFNEFESSADVASASAPKLYPVQGDPTISLPPTSQVSQSDRLVRLSTGAYLGRSNAAGSSAVSISPAVSPTAVSSSSASPSSSTAPSSILPSSSSSPQPSYAPLQSVQKPNPAYASSSRFVPNSGSLPGFSSFPSSQQYGSASVNHEGMVLIPSRADAPLPMLSSHEVQLLPSTAAPNRDFIQLSANSVHNLAINPPSPSSTTTTATTQLGGAAKSPSPSSASPSAYSAPLVASVASAKLVVGSLPSFPGQNEPDAQQAAKPSLPSFASSLSSSSPSSAAVASPSSSSRASSSISPAPAQQQAPVKWKLDITQIPLTPADANRFLVFVGCAGPLNEAGVLEDLRLVGAILPAALRTEETWNRGSFVMSYAQRKYALTFFKRLNGTKVSGSHTNQVYICELHSPPHTTIAKLFRDAGWPNPLDRKAFSSSAAASSSSSASSVAFTSSYAASSPTVQQQQQQPVTRLPSFGGPSAPVSASPYASPSSSSPAAGAAKKKSPAPVPVSYAAAANPSSSASSVAAPSSPAKKASSASKPATTTTTTSAPRIINGVLFEDIVQSEWNKYYLVQSLMVGQEDLECHICLEDMVPGQAIVTLNCLCRFHQRCINGWFDQCVHKMHKEYPRCPTHEDAIADSITSSILLHD